MRNILTALVVIVAIGCALSAGIGIAIIGISSTASANLLVQEMEPPRSKPTPLFTFQCVWTAVDKA